MGERLTMNQPINSPVNRPAIKKLSFRENFDLPLLIIVITLFAIGLMMVYSASWQFARYQGYSEYETVLRQFFIGVVGVIAMIAITFIDYHRYKNFVVLGMLLVMALLAATLIFGSTDASSPRRGLFSGSVQPSEFAKLMVIIYLSFWLYSKGEAINKFTFGLIPMAAIVGSTAGLILAQPDVSAAATVVILGGLLFYIAGGKLTQILLVLGITAVLGVLVVKVSSTASIRVMDYWNGLQNPVQASDHVKWSLEAIINGGIFGVGIGRSTTKFIGLPVASTDSIFSVIAEETGLFGAFIVLGLYIALIWRGLTIAFHAKDDLGKWLASGITIWIALEAAINTGVLVNLLPFAGNALPFISSGGSSLVTVFAGVGLLFGIARQSKLNPQPVSEGSIPHAVVDLRRGDRRGRVSRSVRPTSSR
jgi:cell division protein FtsW